jgi:hypothetical protein
VPKAFAALDYIFDREQALRYATSWGRFQVDMKMWDPASGLSARYVQATHGDPHARHATYRTIKLLRYARDAALPRVRFEEPQRCPSVLVVTEPSCEPSFFDAVQKFATLLQMALADERPGVFGKRAAVHAAQDCGAVKRPVFG